eukprot:2568918-Alexandrium_andersonii.AAC.1
MSDRGCPTATPSCRQSSLARGVHAMPSRPVGCQAMAWIAQLRSSCNKMSGMALWHGGAAARMALWHGGVAAGCSHR